jgi:hypothetical protein
MATGISDAPEIHIEDQKNLTRNDMEKVQVEQMESSAYRGEGHTDFNRVDGEVGKCVSD